MKKLLTLSTALLFTAGAAFAQSNEAELSQNGDTNDASIEQLGSGNGAVLNQGFADQGQNGAFGSIYQDGMDNSASLNQRAWGEDSNDHSIDQIGNENVARADIYNGDNIGVFVQEGDRNSGRMVQSGSENSAAIFQTGNDNYAYSTSTAGDGNITAIVQGVPGSLPVMGGAQPMNLIPGFLPSSGNVATMSVKGNGNEAGILQLGLNNTAGTNPQYTGAKGIGIEGDDNTAGIGQLGMGNSANISVLGNANMALIGQMGSSNSASVMQDGSGNSAVINQSGSGLLLPIID